MQKRKEEQTEIDIDSMRAKILAQTKMAKDAPRRMRLGIEGDAKTGKSGIAMDTDKRTFYLDVDDGGVPTWKANHDSTERITIYNPAEYGEDGELLPYQTQGNIRSFIALAREAAKTEEILFVWDGIDTWLEYCTLYMTGMENARMRPMKTAKQQDWWQRNNPFRQVLKEAKAIDCDQIYITHTKPPFRDEDPQPIWNKWDSHLWSVIRTTQRSTVKGMEYEAYVKSSKYFPSLLNKRFNVLTVSREGEVTWKGLDCVKSGDI